MSQAGSVEYILLYLYPRLKNYHHKHASFLASQSELFFGRGLKVTSAETHCFRGRANVGTHNTYICLFTKINKLMGPVGGKNVKISHFIIHRMRHSLFNLTGALLTPLKDTL